MLGNFNFSLGGGDLTEEQRVQAHELMTVRAEYYRHLANLNDRGAKLLANADPAAEKELAEYSSAVVAPLRMKMARLSTDLAKQAVDLDHIKSMLPMLLAGLMPGIKLPLLFRAVGLDPDMVVQAFDRVQKFIKRDS